jgi:hypothetical protein
VLSPVSTRERIEIEVIVGVDYCEEDNVSD